MTSLGINGSRFCLLYICCRVSIVDNTPMPIAQYNKDREFSRVSTADNTPMLIAQHN